MPEVENTQCFRDKKGRFKKGYKPLTFYKKGFIPWNKGLTKEINKKIKIISENKILPKEIRYCACNCGKSFECKINSEQKFINGHWAKIYSPLRNREIYNKTRRYISTEIRFCKCGCKEKYEVKTNSKKRFISGHNSRVQPNSPKQIQREFRHCKCGCGYLKEVKITSKWKYKSGHNRKKYKVTEKTKKKNSLSHKGKKLNHKVNCQCCICKAIRGETKGIKRPNLSGEKHPFFNKFGKDHPAYIDGRSYFPYPDKFNRKLKTFIRIRDNYTCQKCEVIEEKCNRKLSIHHIDYNKENCSENNLITLCQGCNGKVNKNRDYWTKHFIKMLM